MGPQKVISTLECQGLLGIAVLSFVLRTLWLHLVPKRLPVSEDTACVYVLLDSLRVAKDMTHTALIAGWR